LKLSATLELPFNNPAITVSMDFQDAALKDILKILSIQSGLNFIASEGVENRKITLYMDKVAIKEAMDKLFKANNLAYEMDKESSIFIVKDLGKPQVETVTKVFYLKHATVSSSALIKEKTDSLSSESDISTNSTSSSTSSSSSSSDSSSTSSDTTIGIADAIKKLLSEHGSVIEDRRTNSLIVTDTINRMPMIAQTIAALDVPVPQVMLEVEMLDVNKNRLEKIGIKYISSMNSSMFQLVAKGAILGNTNFPLPGSSKSPSQTITGGSFDFFNANAYNMYADFIKQDSDTKILARPRILTLNNETAEIKITTHEAIGTISLQQGQGSAASTTTSAERVDTGVSLRITPQISLETGDVTMFIVPIVTDATTSNTFSTGSTTYKDPEERTTKSLVRVKDGETIILGGLIRHEKSETITKLPFLGDMPLIGAAFRHRNIDKNRERELLVFITPRIIKDSVPKLAQAKIEKMPEREQNISRAADRDNLINTSLNTFEASEADKKKK
jgi:type IV pilus assembly protein PilQ